MSEEHVSHGGWRLAVFGICFMSTFGCFVLSAALPDGTLRELAQNEMGAFLISTMLATKLNRKAK